MLPSKMIPNVKNQKQHTKKTSGVAAAPLRKKARPTSGTEVEVIDEDTPCAGRSSNTAARSSTISPASSFQASYPVSVKVCNIS